MRMRALTPGLIAAPCLLFALSVAVESNWPVDDQNRNVSAVTAGAMPPSAYTKVALSCNESFADFNRGGSLFTDFYADGASPVTYAVGSLNVPFDVPEWNDPGPHFVSTSDEEAEMITIDVPDTKAHSVYILATGTWLGPGLGHDVGGCYDIGHISLTPVYTLPGAPMFPVLLKSDGTSAGILNGGLMWADILYGPSSNPAAARETFAASPQGSIYLYRIDVDASQTLTAVQLNDNTSDIGGDFGDFTIVAMTLHSCVDADGDGIGDPGVIDNPCLGVEDNCPLIDNPSQEDGDGNNIGDVCDELVIIARSPVDFVLTSPNGSDSIGIALDRSIFNTIGANASYDTTTDYGIGPNGVMGEADDAIRIQAPTFGEWRLVINPEPWADTAEDYFLGIRDPGGNMTGVRDPGGNIIGNVKVTGTGEGTRTSVHDTVVTNDVPPQGTYALCPILVTSQRRGDLNDDKQFDVIDVVGIIGVAFRGAALPLIPEVADVNGDGVASDVVDVVVEIGHVFRGAAQPAP